MAAFAVLYDRSNTPVEPGVLERVLERLKHRGPDGRDVTVAGPAALGHWQFWTTPEEVGEKQPLHLKGLPFIICLDGRIDNRPELFAELNLPASEGAGLSDAALVLRAYDRWGEHCLEHFIGEFALVTWDESRHLLLCARDPLGERTLFYASRGPLLVVASEPWAVAAAFTPPPGLSEVAAAHFFAFKVPADGQTFFEGVFELLPGHLMRVSSAALEVVRYWQPDPSRQLRGLSDQEYAERFLSLLQSSLSCRLRSTTPVGFLMSGGLDSTTLASLAARHLAPQPVKTFSYVFNELIECDEREYIDPVVEKWGLESVRIPCDDAWPFKDWPHWPHNPNHPEGNPYRLLKERAYHAAHEHGLRVLIPGSYGDELYGGAEDWFADLLFEGRFRHASRELLRQLRFFGIADVLKSDFIRRLLRRLVDSLPGGRRLHRPSQPPAWLTASSAARLASSPSRPHPRFELRTGILDLLASQASIENVYAAPHALDLRHPYRDRRLVEFVLSLPAYLLYDRGHYKRILRLAMQSILPRQVLTRTNPTSLAPLYNRGLQRERAVIQEWVHRPGAAWSPFVRSPWLQQHWERPASPPNDGAASVIPWLSLSFDSWVQKYFCYN